VKVKAKMIVGRDTLAAVVGQLGKFFASGMTIIEAVVTHSGLHPAGDSKTSPTPCRTVWNKSTDGTVTTALAQAETYARRAWPALGLGQFTVHDSTQSEMSERVMLRLKILFLFPELPEWERDLLATVYLLRQILKRLIDQSPSQRPLAMRAQTEGLTRRLEHTYLALVGEVENLACCKALSPTQQLVLRHEFTRFRLDEDACNAQS